MLSSRKLTTAQAELLLNAGIAFTDYNAINISFIDFDAPTYIENAIVTSQNTVRAIAQKNITIKRCFCVGSKTKTALEKLGYNVCEMRPYGQQLADCIVNAYANAEFVFFCGNKHRPEIPKALTQKQISFSKITVYHTSLNPVKFESEFDGILFFSPSQVKSYTQLNQLNNQIAFCIGTSTAAEAQKHTQHIITAHKPTVENTIAQVVKTFRYD